MTPRTNGPFVVEVSAAESMMLRAALRSYIEAFRAHAAADVGLTHPPEQVENVRVTAGRLIWRLEELTTEGGRIVHSEHAVAPSP